MSTDLDVVKTMEDEPISLWIREGGHYIMVSIGKGEKRFVIGSDGARTLGVALLQASDRADQLTMESDPDLPAENLVSSSEFKARLKTIGRNPPIVGGKPPPF